MEYVEYPKYLPDANVVVQNRAEEEAVLNKTAIIGLLVHSAAGDTYGIVGYKPAKENK